MTATMQEITASSSSYTTFATAKTTITRRDDSPLVSDITPPRFTPTDALAPTTSGSIAAPSNTPLGSVAAEPTNWLYSNDTLAISCWLLIFSIFSFIWLLGMWCYGTLDHKLNYYPHGHRQRRHQGVRSTQQLPRYSDSSDEHAPMDWREAIEMAPRSLVVEGRVYAPVVRLGEVVVREANGHTWRQTEEAFVRDLRMQERMRSAGMM